MQTQQTRPIGIYDSGIGGLTILRTLRTVLPKEHFIYFADTAHLPYGNLSPDTIVQHTKRIISWLQDQMQVKLIVSACHTSSATALEQCAHLFHTPIIGTIQPLLHHLSKQHIHQNIGIIATPTSVASQTHQKRLRQHGIQGNIVSIPCPALVTLIESFADTQTLQPHLQTYLRPFHTQALETLIYGCSHYPLIQNTIENLLPSHVECIDPADTIAKATQVFLTQNHLLSPHQHTGQLTVYCSQHPEAFKQKLHRLTSLIPNLDHIEQTCCYLV